MKCRGPGIRSKNPENQKQREEAGPTGSAMPDNRRCPRCPQSSKAPDGVAVVDVGTDWGASPGTARGTFPEAGGPAPQSGTWVCGGWLWLTHFRAIRSDLTSATWHGPGTTPSPRLSRAQKLRHLLLTLLVTASKKNNDHPPRRKHGRQPAHAGSALNARLSPAVSGIDRKCFVTEVSTES